MTYYSIIQSPLSPAPGLAGRPAVLPLPAVHRAVLVRELAGAVRPGESELPDVALPVLGGYFI